MLPTKNLSLSARHYAMAGCLCICLSVSSSQVGVLLKWLNGSALFGMDASYRIYVSPTTPIQLHWYTILYGNSFLPRYAVHSRYYSHGPVSVCLPVSVTSRSSTKTAKRGITQTTPHDSPGNSSFLMPKISAKFHRGHPLRGRQMQVWWVKIGDFRQITG